jgi:hypothetical protein
VLASHHELEEPNQHELLHVASDIRTLPAHIKEGTTHPNPSPGSLKRGLSYLGSRNASSSSFSASCSSRSWFSTSFASSEIGSWSPGSFIFAVASSPHKISSVGLQDRKYMPRGNYFSTEHGPLLFFVKSDPGFYLDAGFWGRCRTFVSHVLYSPIMR